MTAGPRAPRRRSRALRWLLAFLVLLPMVEIIVLIAVGKTIGVGWTIGILVGMAVLGAWLSRRESGRTFRALQAALSSGKMPTDEVTDAILVSLGAALLILPGFLTDLVGLLLVLPFTRPAARRLLQAAVAAKALGATRGSGPVTTRPSPAPGRGQVIEGEIVSEEPAPSRWTDPGHPPAVER